MDACGNLSLGLQVAVQEKRTDDKCKKFKLVPPKITAQSKEFYGEMKGRLPGKS